MKNIQHAKSYNSVHERSSRKNIKKKSADDNKIMNDYPACQRLGDIQTFWQCDTVWHSDSGPEIFF